LKTLHKNSQQYILILQHQLTHEHFGGRLSAGGRPPPPPLVKSDPGETAMRCSLVETHCIIGSTQWAYTSYEYNISSFSSFYLMLFILL